MILAQSPTQALLLVIVGMLCWGLWASLYRQTGKWRYELFYFDVAFGVILAIAIYSLTVGRLGFDGFSIDDDLMHTGKRQWMLAFAAGTVFNLANMIMMGAVVVAGMSVALPLGLGVTLMLGVGFSLILNHAGNPLLLFVGSACLLMAVVCVSVAYSLLISARQDKLVQEGKVKTTASVPGYGKGMLISTNAPTATKGLLLAIVSGVLMWIMFPLLRAAKAGDQGLGPYALMAMFALGLTGSSMIFNMFFVNLPVEGEPIPLGQYFSGSMGTHLVGLVSGAVLATGLLAILVAQAGAPETLVSPTLLYALEQGAVLIGALWGIFVWKDFRDCQPRVRAMVWMFILLFLAGIVSFGFAGKAVVHGA
jgi:glucose uptake protein